MLKKIQKFTLSFIDFAKSGFQQVPNSIKNSRLEICKTCDMFQQKEISCRECGCYLEIKTGWATESCPLGKWNGIHIAQQKEIQCGGCNKQNKKSE